MADPSCNASAGTSYWGGIIGCGGPDFKTEWFGLAVSKPEGLNVYFFIDPVTTFDQEVNIINSWDTP